MLSMANIYELASSPHGRETESKISALC